MHDPEPRNTITNSEPSLRPRLSEDELLSVFSKGMQEVWSAGAVCLYDTTDDAIAAFQALCRPAQIMMLMRSYAELVSSDTRQNQTERRRSPDEQRENEPPPVPTTSEDKSLLVNIFGKQNTKVHLEFPPPATSVLDTDVLKQLERMERCAVDTRIVCSYDRLLGAWFWHDKSEGIDEAQYSFATRYEALVDAVEVFFEP